MRRRGFTLVEIIIVIAIIGIMVVIMTGGMNFTAMVDKSNDARRKKDLARIKAAFEEYYNDKGCYPTQTVIDGMNTLANCNKPVFSPYLGRWPCDPNQIIYPVIVADGDCPNWFKVMSNLKNKNDTDIPRGWYGDAYKYFWVGKDSYTYNRDQVNYGVTSTNISWYNRIIDRNLCPIVSECLIKVSEGVCNSITGGCSGDNCYVSTCVYEQCRVDKCPL